MANDDQGKPHPSDEKRTARYGRAAGPMNFLARLDREDAKRRRRNPPAEPSGTGGEDPRKWAAKNRRKRGPDGKFEGDKK